MGTVNSKTFGSSFREWKFYQFELNKVRQINYMLLNFVSTCVKFALILVNRHYHSFLVHRCCAHAIFTMQVCVVPTVRLIVCVNGANTKLWAYLIVPEVK